MEDTTICPACHEDTLWKRRCQHCGNELPGQAEPITQRMPVVRLSQPQQGKSKRKRKYERNDPSALLVRHPYIGSWLIGSVLALIAGLVVNHDQFSTSSALLAAVGCWTWLWAIVAVWCAITVEPRGSGGYFNQPGWLAHVHDGDWLHGGQCPDPSWHWTNSRRGRRYEDGSTDYSRKHGVPSGGQMMPSDSAGAGIGNGL